MADLHAPLVRAAAIALMHREPLPTPSNPQRELIWIRMGLPVHTNTVQNTVWPAALQPVTHVVAAGVMDHAVHACTIIGRMPSSKPAHPAILNLPTQVQQV
ncbi:hypothetical protein BKG80_24540 [Mycobacteroides chelonae]|nr:hypothetical protein AOT86_25175 [Mycobacteroides sp. H072]KRQ39616.1 hypothetical protein AOT84_06745 [Mycobacteroides sp. H002]KRQ54286.1 hypothetical protein AOT85_04880 [Mycobacteroides sp. H054]KRQ66411.1 hypothetical protein AOT83_23220 [Mycobacteroides sp. H001]OHU34020.1 hypothetical protein BKG80_24540 [Mycobacteroides chelonae]